LWKQNKYELDILFQNEGDIAFMRECLAETALAKKVDYLLWLDTDQKFPPDLIKRMIEDIEKYNCEGVTGLYTWKVPPFLPHVYSSYNEETEKFRVAGQFPLNEAFEVKGAGFGCLMLKASVFERIERPWFEMKIENKKYVYGEDLWFFKKAQPIKLLCDPTIISPHLTQIEVDINSHIEYNELEVENGWIKADEEQLKKISSEHLNKLNR
jgi:hypothetical protein